MSCYSKGSVYFTSVFVDWNGFHEHSFILGQGFMDIDMGRVFMAMLLCFVFINIVINRASC